MTTSARILSLAVSGTLLLLAGCGGEGGVPLGDFPALNKTEGDQPFKLTAPSSKSPAAFSYTSSDQKVAKIEGDMVTILGAGTSTITAQQGRMGSYNPTSTSTTLTVAPRICTEPSVKEDGVCVVPATGASYVNSGGLTWMPATATVMTWAVAKSFCETVKANGATGWRLPTQAESNALVASGQLAGKGWTLPDTWTSSAGSAEKTHVAVNLSSNLLMSLTEDKKVSVTCVQ
jgi:hypothetical protein